MFVKMEGKKTFSEVLKVENEMLSIGGNTPKEEPKDSGKKPLLLTSHFEKEM